MQRTIKLEPGRLCRVMYACKAFADIDDRDGTGITLDSGTEVAYVGKSHYRRQQCQTNGRWTSYYIRYVLCLTGHGPRWINIKNLQRMRMPKNWKGQKEVASEPDVYPFDDNPPF